MNEELWIQVSEEMKTLIRMINGTRRSIDKAYKHNEPEDVVKSLNFVLREEQAQLADVIIEKLENLPF